MGTQGTGRKRSTKKERSTAEDDALNLIAREAEARLAAKRAARAEAREIRMKELERQQKELSDDDERMSVGSRGSVRVEDRDYLEKGSRAGSALTAATLTSLGGSSSRRGSGETALTLDAETSIREIKDTLTEVEEKYRKAMVSNAQLDNEKNNLMYQVDTLKDSLMELEELLSESRRGYDEKVKEFDREKHAHGVLQFQFNDMKETLKQSEELLNKHGIVLGPDLNNINGEVGEAEVEGSPSADPASQPAKDSQPSPTEGNSMLGNTEEAQLRSSREEEVDPEPHQQMFAEAKENHLSSDSLCNVAGVSTLETPIEENPTVEQKTDLATEEDNVEGSGLSDDFNVDIDEPSIIEVKDVLVCGAELPEKEKSQGGDLVETNSELGNTESKSSSVDTHSDDTQEACNVHEGKESKPEDIEESNLRNAESCHQQNVSQVVMKEHLPDESGTGVSNTKPQQKPENAEEAEKEAEEMSSKSQPQGATSSGKKKKKKNTESKCSSVTTHNGDIKEASTNIYEENENKQEDIEESNLRNAESCHQQKVPLDVMKEHLPDVSSPGVSNPEPQQKPENADEAEKEEEEEMSSKSQPQGATASGKKKKKKKRGKKKGTHEDKNQQKDGTEKEKVDSKEDIESATKKEPDMDISVTQTIKELRVDQVTNEQDRQETREVDASEVVKPPETLSHNETLKESRQDHVADQHDNLQGVQAAATSEKSSYIEAPKEIGVDHITKEQNKGQCSETETVEAVMPAENVPHIEAFERSKADIKKDEQDKEQTLEIGKAEETESRTSPIPEPKLGTSDLIDDNTGAEITDDLDKECPTDVENSGSGTDTSSNVIHTESEIVDRAEDELVSIKETESECTTKNPEKTFETNSQENTEAELHVPSHDDTDDLNDGLKSLSGSLTPAAINLGSGDTAIKDSESEPKDATETVKDDEEPEADTKQESSSASGIPSSHDGDNPELIPYRNKDELNEDLREPECLLEPESSIHKEKSNSCDSASLMKSTDAFDAEKSPLGTVMQDEELVDVDSQTLQCKDQIIGSKAEVSSNTEVDMLNTPNSPKEEEFGIGSTMEKDSTAKSEGPEYKNSPNDQQRETHLGPLSEQLCEPSKDKCEDNDSPQPILQDSDEEEGEDQKGLSFDFDEMDIEAAIEMSIHKNPNQEEIEDGKSSNGSSGLGQSNTESDENSQQEPVESQDMKCTEDNGSQVDRLDKESDTLLEDNPNSLGNEEAKSEKGEHVCEKQNNMPEVEVGVSDEPRHIIEEIVVENINPAVSLSVEQGLNAIKHERQGEHLVLPKSADQVASNKEPPQAGNPVRKNSKKGKGKGKEDCKMS